MPQLDRRNRSWWRVLDERSPTGGRPKAWLFLTHPGPSALVTALVVAAAALLTRQAPSVRVTLGLVLAMLPCQLSIGALNDWADVELDRVAKPYKPIPRGLVRRGAALAFALTAILVSLGAAAWLGPAVLGVDALGIAAGVSYDLALKRTPFSVIAWWPGFAVVPLIAMVATGRLEGAAAVVPLAGLLAVAVQIANGLPDIEGDRRGGANTLPAALGVTRTRWLMGLTLGVSAVYVVAVRGSLGQGALALVGAALLAVAALIPLLPRGAPRLAFPLLAVLAAGGTVSWLAALPTPAPG